MGNEKILYKDVDLNKVAKPDSLKFINRYFTGNNFFNDTGLTMNEEGDKVPVSNGVPRMFIIKDGQVRTFEEENIIFGSREFWQTAAKGEIFVYPTGEKYPVQMQLKDPTGPYDVRVKFSKPLDPHNIPEIEVPGPVPREPKWYHRWFSFGSNKKLCQDYDNYIAKQKQLSDTVNAITETIDQAFGAKRTEEAFNTEKAQTSAAAADIAEKEARKRAEKLLTTANTYVTQIGDGITNALRIYGPVPKKVPELVKKVKDNRNGFLYTEEEFAKLSTIDITGLKVGETQIDELEFASLALCAGTDPKIGIAAQNIAKDPSVAIETIKNDGFTQEEAEEMVTESIREMYGRSLIGHRSDIGAIFEPAVEPARQKAKNALISYQNGDKEPLAEIMARTALCIGGEDTTRTSLTHSTLYSQNTMVCKAISVMERDSELKELARQKYEQHEKEFRERHPDLAKNFLKSPSFDDQLKTIRQMEEMGKLNQKSNEARQALLNAKVNNKILTAEEKHKYVKDILLFETASYRYTADTSMTMSPEPNMWNKEHRALKDHIKTLPKDPNARGAESKGSFSSAPVSADTFMDGALTPRTVPKPEILDVLDDPKKRSEMEKAVDNLIKKDGLANDSTDQLIKKLFKTLPSIKLDYQEDSLMAKIIMANPKTGKDLENEQSQQIKKDLAAEEPAAKTEGTEKLVQSIM